MSRASNDKWSGFPDFGVAALIFAVCVLSRLPFTSRLLYNMDSVQFALGMREFDVALHQPHPPGYFLYVMMGRAMSLVFSGPNTALIAVSILFSGLAAVMLYVLADELFGKAAGITAAVIGITSPLMWLHGEVALSYMPEAFMSLLVAWLCLKAIRGGYGYALAASVALAVAGGIRQNTMVFLMPLWLYSVYGFGLKRAAYCLAAFALAVSAWFVPMTIATGGYERYSAALRAHWLDANWRGIHMHWIAFNAKYMSFFILSGLILAAVPLIELGLGALHRRRRVVADRDMAVFFALWLLPAFLFHLVIFTHPAVPGHSLIYLVGLIILAARGAEYTVSQISSAARRLSPVAIRAAVAGLIAAANTAFFLFAPSPFSANGIAGHDRTLSGYLEAVRSGFSPKDTEIIATDRFLYSYRHAMYYLPEYRVHNTTRISTPEGPRIFWGRDRRTHKARFMEPGRGITRFVYFINYDETQENALPDEAIVDDIGGGDLLIHYEKIDGLYRVSGIAPLMPPGLNKRQGRPVRDGQ